MKKVKYVYLDTKEWNKLYNHLINIKSIRIVCSGLIKEKISCVYMEMPNNIMLICPIDQNYYKSKTFKKLDNFYFNNSVWQACSQNSHNQIINS